MRNTKISVLTLAALPNDKHMAIVAFMANALREYGIADTSLAVFVAAYLAAYEKENHAFMRIDRKGLTKKMNEADTERINALRVLRDLLKTFAFRVNEEKKTLAANVLEVIDHYGGTTIYNQPIDSRTGNITNIIEDLDEKFADAITALELTDEVQVLKSANELFLQCQIDRDRSDADYGKKAMADARVETDNAWRAIVDTTNYTIAYGPEEEVETLVPFAKFMNVEIDKYRIQTGQGVGGNTGSSSTDSTDNRVRNATFIYASGNETKYKVEIGAPLVAPPNTPGYVWRPRVEEVMPPRNIVFREVPVDEAEAEATFHFFDHSEEVIKQIIGTPLQAPENTFGYHWDPVVPELMPAENTSYYELPDEQQEEEEENNLVNVVFMNAANEVLKTMQVPVGGTIQKSDMPAIPSDMVWVPGLDGVNQMLAVAQPGSTVYCTQFREEY